VDQQHGILGEARELRRNCVVFGRKQIDVLVPQRFAAAVEDDHAMNLRARPQRLERARERGAGGMIDDRRDAGGG
jgi:hypothetical protein